MRWKFIYLTDSSATTCYPFSFSMHEIRQVLISSSTSNTNPISKTFLHESNQSSRTEEPGHTKPISFPFSFDSEDHLPASSSSYHRNHDIENTRRSKTYIHFFLSFLFFFLLTTDQYSSSCFFPVVVRNEEPTARRHRTLPNVLRMTPSRRGNVACRPRPSHPTSCARGRGVP